VGLKKGGALAEFEDPPVQPFHAFGFLIGWVESTPLTA